MKKQIVIIVSSMFFSIFCISQPKGSNEWHGSWEFGVPLGNNYISNFYTFGLNLGYSHFVADNLAVGIESGWNNYYEYASIKPYKFHEGETTADQHIYIHTLPVTLTLTRHFRLNKILSPYARVGLGAQYCEQDLRHNVYKTTNTNWGFVGIPEVGTAFHFNKYSPWCLNLSLRYKYSTNSAPDFNVNYIQTVNLVVGFACTNK